VICDALGAGFRMFIFDLAICDLEIFKSQITRSPNHKML